MIDVGLLDYQLRQAGLPVVGVSSNGRIDYSRELTAQEQTTAAAVIAAHDPNGLLPEEQNARDYREARQAALNLLTSGIDQWAGMTATQKNAWVGANFDAVLRIIRALIRITTKVRLRSIHLTDGIYRIQAHYLFSFNSDSAAAHKPGVPSRPATVPRWRCAPGNPPTTTSA